MSNFKTKYGPWAMVAGADTVTNSARLYRGEKIARRADDFPLRGTAEAGDR
jgi:hypothetical protein